jgi:hypothetical protein
MSLIVRDPKERKTDNPNYFKEYRTNKSEHIKALERCHYYKKKYSLEDEFISDFGEYSGDVFKIKKSFDKLITSCPSLEQHIIKLLQKKSDQ